MIKSKTRFFLLIAIIGLLVVLILDIIDKDFNFHDILVESHGLIFDLFVFGILITIYETLESKKNDVKRYKEEIDDFRFWFSEESKHRVKGLISRLIKLNVKKIDIKHCNITGCPTIKKMIEWDFSGAKIYNSWFYDIDLTGSRFFLSDIFETSFIKSNLSGCTFGTAKLFETNFKDCFLGDTSFLNAYVQDKDWLNILKNNGNRGIDDLKEKYKISIDTIEIDSVTYYQILDKNKKSDKAKSRNDLTMESFENVNKSIINGAISIIKTYAQSSRLPIG